MKSIYNAHYADEQGRHWYLRTYRNDADTAWVCEIRVGDSDCGFDEAMVFSELEYSGSINLAPWMWMKVLAESIKCSALDAEHVSWYGGL